MFSLSILLVFGVIINANGHLLKQLLHNMHEKYHPNHGHHSSMFVHSGPGRFPPFGPPPQFGPEYGPYGPPPFGFPPHHAPDHTSHHHNCQNQPCNFPYPNNGQLPYPSFNPHHGLNYQPTPINTPNTININNINSNSQQDATSISSAPTDVNVNVIPTGSNVPIYPTGNNGLGSDVLTNSQSVHAGNQADINYGQTQPLNPAIAVSSGYPTNDNINNINKNNNAYPISTSQNNLNEFGSTIGNNMNNLATLNGQANGLNAQTTNLNAQTTNLNAQTTSLNAQTTNLNSNNAMFGMANQFGIDLNAFNAMNNLFNGAATTPISNNLNNFNNNNDNNIPQTVPTYTELPPVSSTTNRAGMEYDIDIRFGDNQKKNEPKN